MAWRYLYSRISYFPAIMTDAFVSSEVDRTKSRWVAKVFKEFGGPKTTLRGLFYFSLSRSAADYPICGGFVGEIRITRPYHENDGPKLVKWADKAQRLDFLPANAILKEEPGEHTILPEACSSQTIDWNSGLTDPPSILFWHRYAPDTERCWSPPRAYQIIWWSNFSIEPHEGPQSYAFQT